MPESLARQAVKAPQCSRSWFVLRALRHAAYEKGGVSATGPQAVCGPEEALCAPCGQQTTGPSVALTFSYEFFELVELHSDYEVRQRVPSFSHCVPESLPPEKPNLFIGSGHLLTRLCLPPPPFLQRYRPVLTEEFFENMQRRGIGVSAVRIEPGAPPHRIRAPCLACGLWGTKTCRPAYATS